MDLLRRVVVSAVVGSLALTTVVPRVHADEIAPALAIEELREKARLELKLLAYGLEASDQRRLVGLYLAFDGSPSDPSAMVACDDDGDYVIVLSDALLRLVALVSRAQSYDEANGTHVVEQYAVFMARAQITGRRLIPPPAGFFRSDLPGGTTEPRLREALSFVVSRELAHLRARDLVCPHPTATREHGDDTWTDDEQRQALVSAAVVYRGSSVPRDVEAAQRTRQAGRSNDGALGVLRFFERLEAERPSFVPTYLRQHPDAAARAAALVAAARDVTP